MTVDGPQIGAGMSETAERDGAFPRLDEGQMSRLRQLGERRAVEPGEVLFEAGDAESDFYVIESGAVAIVQGYGRENRVIALHGARRFLGELGMISGQRLYLTGVVRDRGAVIQVPLERLREIVSQDKALSDLILGAFIARRSILIDAGTGIKLIGSRFSPDSRRLREYLVRNRMPHQWIDLEEDEQADALLSGLAVEPDDTPVVVASGGEILRKPTNAEVGRAIGIAAKGAPPAMCDLLVIGGGPAGLAASVYAASEGLDTQTIEAVATGGQAGTSAKIENYLGFPAGVSGSELTQRAGLQAIKFGVRLDRPGRGRRAEELTGPARDRAFDGRGRDRSGCRDRDRRSVQAPRRAAARAIRDGRRLLRSDAGRGAALHGRSRRDRRRRQLGGAGGDVPLPPYRALQAADPRR